MHHPSDSIPLPVDGSIDTSDCYLWIGVPTTSRPVISFSLLPPGTCIHFNGAREGTREGDARKGEGEESLVSLPPVGRE